MTAKALPELPRLPVPPIEQSVQLYLSSIEPFLLQQTNSQSEFEELYNLRKEWGAQLAHPTGIGQTLQNRLIDIDRVSPYNWLDDNYWIKAAYLSSRLPLPVNFNWWILMKHDRDIPNNVIESIPQPGRFTDWQLRRAATLVHRSMLFKQMVDRQEIIPDSSRAARWQRHWMLDSLYGITRIPHKPNDQINISNKANSRHIIVLARGHIYSLDILRADFTLVSAKEIESNLWSIVNHLTLQSTAIPIGSLTGLDRDQWTEAREHLLRLDSIVNRQSLSTIEDALFALCLDDITKPGGLQGHIQTASTNYDGFNRWFDKSFSFIVESNSRASVSGEHSPCDALIPAIMTDFVLSEGVGPGLCDPSVKASSHESTSGWKKLQWVTDQKICQFIQDSNLTVEAISQNSDCDLFSFDQYGTEYIKRSARHSPDAYIQMAMQLAWYRQNGTVVSTYETGLTRLFKHGRTDVIRTLSRESYDWVKAMDREKDCHLVYNLFVQAISKHNHYTKQVSLGRAFDRHFLGLRLQHRPEEDGPLPELFTDPIFNVSSEWQLSTSGINAGERFIGTGFGCYGRGYGLSYLVAPHSIKFGIETKNSDPRTNAFQFGHHYLANALNDIRILCETATGKRPSKDNYESIQNDAKL